MIPKATVDRILDATQIVDVVGDFVTLKRRGANYTACCPFHNEKTPSFYVSPAKGIYKCFGCGKAGTAVNFVMEHESLSYVEALKYLAKKYHIEVIEKEESAEEIALRQRNESLLLVSEFAWKFFREQLKTPEGRSIGYAYFKSRGLEDATIDKFGLGWAPVSHNSLSKAARDAGYREEFLIDTGLSVKRSDGSLADRFFDRVMFPIHSVSGRVIAFGGRTLKTDKTVAKYVNSPETEIYIKSRSLYGIYFAKNEISRQDKCLLVEGYLDVISMHQLGITNVVASSGTSLTVEQIRLIRKFTENVTIIYDGDPAGIHAALRGIGLVLKEGLNVKVVLLPDGDDPDSFSRKHTLDEVSDFIAEHEQDFISFKTDLLLGEAGNDPLKKANLINDIADTIAMIPDAVKRSVYVETCSARFNIESQILFERIRGTRSDMLIEERKRQERESRYREHGTGNSQDTGARTDNDGTAGQDVGRTQAETVTDTAGGPAVTPSDPMMNDPYLAPSERDLLGFILNNGEDPLAFDVDSDLHTDEPMTVADFIDCSLADDGEIFSNDVYRRVYDAYFDMYGNGLDQDQISKRLMDSPERDIAKVAADLIIPKYDLTVQNYRDSLTSEATQLVMFVPRAVIIYKIKRIDKIIREYSDRLASIPPEDTAGAEEVMSSLNRMYRTRNMLNERLGRRFIRK